MAQYSNLHRPDVGFVWNITDIVLRDTFKKSEIGDVILPFVLLRRIDCILEPVNEKVRNQYNQLKDKITMDKLDPALRKIAGHKFYNISRHTLMSLLDDAKNISMNFSNYMSGFNSEVTTIFENFQFDKVVVRLTRNNLLYRMIQEITQLDFSLEAVDNHDMGYVFEELIRIANDQSNEQAGEHFTPRDVIRMMSAILFTPDADSLRHSGIIRSIYDPACGTGGMVNVGKRYILEEICKDSEKPTIVTYGQELNEQSYAIAKSEALVSGENADNIKLGNSFTQDQFATKRFHYIMANPPYGVTWKKDQEFIINESLNPDGRFTAGTPRTSDGQLLFVQHMLSKMEADGSRVGVVTNGSPLFSGGAGSGESNIRKWIIENDWLECIVALPSNLFYNTPISTYLWFFTNKKKMERIGKVQLINAVDFCTPCAKSLGNKRYEVYDFVEKVLQIYLDFKENEFCKIMPNSDFGQYELTIEQPMRDEDGNVVKRAGKKVPDTKKRDTEKVPLDCNVKQYFTEEVLPHIDPESWIDFSRTRTNYAINFTEYFYKYENAIDLNTLKETIQSKELAIFKLVNSIFDDKQMEDYKANKDSNILWLDKIPSHWHEEKLKHISTCNDEVLPEDTPDSELIHYVEISDVDSVSGIKNYTDYTFGDAPSRARRITRKNDVIISTVRTYLKAIATVKEDGLIVSTGFAVIRPTKVNQKFLAYSLLNDDFLGEVISKSVGVSYPAINSTDLIEIKLPMPPKEEQEAIVSYLDIKVGQIDSAIEKMEQALENLKSYKSALITEAVTGKIDLREWKPKEENA